MRFTFLLDGKEVPKEEILITQEGTTFVWDEKNQGLPSIWHGIPAYDGISMVYQRDGQAILDVELQDPVVVASATKPEEWGFFQFPSIYRSAAGPLVARWQMVADHVSDYGKGDNGFRLSSDNGKTWYISESAPFGGGFLIPSTGERITSRIPAAAKVSDLQLPQPIGTSGGFTFYRMNELPAAQQGIYLNRWDKNGAWSEIHANLDDPGAVRYATSGYLPVAWWGDIKMLPDNSLVTAMYPMFYERIAGVVDIPSGVSVYRSTDNGRNWKIRSKIPYSYDPAVDPAGAQRNTLGFTEPGFEILSDGTLFCVLRIEAITGITVVSKIFKFISSTFFMKINVA